jgi:hypothetical protein
LRHHRLNRFGWVDELQRRLCGAGLGRCQLRDGAVSIAGRHGLALANHD